MIEIQIRRPCSKTQRLEPIRGTPYHGCPECHTSDLIGCEVEHGLATEWMPMHEAVALAQAEGEREAERRKIDAGWNS